MTDPYNLLKKYVAVDELPPEVDIAFYRYIHDDLCSFSDAQLLEHFKLYGRDEGRLASPAAQRAGLLRTISPDAAILEIGPFTRPAIRGTKVKYFDVMDRERLLERAARHGMPTTNAPEIDYVSASGDLAIVPDASFDRVFSSHCIEHQPNLIRHLQEVGRILKPGGRYYLAIPDKRYCFDHFLTEACVDELVRAHEERRTAHTFKSVYEHTALTTHNDPALHWRGEHTDPRSSQLAERAEYASKIYQEANGGYIDVHAWQFTPRSFRETMAELAERGLSPLKVERVYDTVYGQNEFTAVLVLP
jgi:SAM-dependent methyltransferase